MRTEAMTVEEITVAIPFSICEGNPVGIIGAINAYCEGFEVESFSFLGVPFGFFDLADHSRVHFLISYRR